MASVHADWVSQVSRELSQCPVGRDSYNAAISFADLLEIDELPLPAVSWKISECPDLRHQVAVGILTWLPPPIPYSTGKFSAWNGLIVSPQVVNGRLQAAMAIFYRQRLLWTGWNKAPVPLSRFILLSAYRHESVSSQR